MLFDIARSLVESRSPIEPTFAAPTLGAPPVARDNPFVPQPAPRPLTSVTKPMLPVVTAAPAIRPVLNAGPTLGIRVPPPALATKALAIANKVKAQAAPKPAPIPVARPAGVQPLSATTIRDTRPAPKAPPPPPRPAMQVPPLKGYAQATTQGASLPAIVKPAALGTRQLAVAQAPPTGGLPPWAPLAGVVAALLFLL